MSCTAPVVIRRPFGAKVPKGTINDGKMIVPCGRCVGCSLDYSRSWSVRCYHESFLHEHNFFLTLTLDDDHLHFNADGLMPSLDPQHMVLFVRDLRNRGLKIRFFYCGEYGTKYHRPHYHMIVFGLSLTDLKPGSKGLFTSEFLNGVWGRGSVAVGLVTPESIAYCCRYTTKKVLGRPFQYYYDRGLYPEFVRMSRRPGIGAGFYERYRGDIYNMDSCLINGFRSKVPRYYDKLLEARDESLFRDIKIARHSRALLSGVDVNYPDVRRNFSRDLIQRSKLTLKSDVF